MAASWDWAWAAARAAWADLKRSWTGFEFLRAGCPFLEQKLKPLIIGAGLNQLRLGLGHPGPGLVHPGLVLLPGQGDQGVSRLYPGAGLHPDFSHPAGHLGRDLGQTLGDDLSQDFQFPGNRGFADDQDPAAAAAGCGTASPGAILPKCSSPASQAMKSRATTTRALRPRIFLGAIMLLVFSSLCSYEGRSA